MSLTASKSKLVKESVLQRIFSFLTGKPKVIDSGISYKKLQKQKKGIYIQPGCGTGVGKKGSILDCLIYADDYPKIYINNLDEVKESDPDVLK